MILSVIPWYLHNFEDPNYSTAMSDWIYSRKLSQSIQDRHDISCHSSWFPQRMLHPALHAFFCYLISLFVPPRKDQNVTIDEWRKPADVWLVMCSYERGCLSNKDRMVKKNCHISCSATACISKYIVKGKFV